jgi:hypothetical protein
MHLPISTVREARAVVQEARMELRRFVNDGLYTPKQYMFADNLLAYIDHVNEKPDQWWAENDYVPRMLRTAVELLSKIEGL